MVKSSMIGIEGRDAADGPVVGGGGRSPSMPSPGRGGTGDGAAARLGPRAPGQRWGAVRKR